MKLLNSGGALIALSCLLVGCAGSEPPQTPETPEPLDSEEEPVAAASSASVQKGIDALKAQDFESAKRILTDAVAKSPKDPQAAYYLGVALEGVGDVDAAVEHYQKALELQPGFPEPSVNLSAIALDKGDGAAALAAADAGLKQNPKHPELLTNRGMALLLVGDNQGAAKALGEAVSVAPDSESLRYSYAEASAAAGDKQTAVKELLKLTAAKSVEVSASTARLLGKLGEWQGCIEASTQAIGLQQAPELFVQRGLCHHGKKAEELAKADFEAAIAASDTYAPAHYYLARYYIVSGDKKKAKAELQRVIELAGKTEGVGKAAAKSLSEL